MKSVRLGFWLGLFLLLVPASGHAGGNINSDIKVDAQTFSRAEAVQGQIQSEMASIKDLCETIQSLIDELVTAQSTKPGGNEVKDAASKLGSLEPKLQKSEAALKALDPSPPGGLAPKLKAALDQAKAAQTTRTAAQASAKTLIVLGAKPADPGQIKQWEAKQKGAVDALVKLKAQAKTTAGACTTVRQEVASSYAAMAASHLGGVAADGLSQVGADDSSGMRGAISNVLAASEADTAARAKASGPGLEQAITGLEKDRLLLAALKATSVVASNVKSALDATIRAKAAAVAARGAALVLVGLGPKPSDPDKAKLWSAKRKAALDSLFKARQDAQQAAATLAALAK